MADSYDALHEARLEALDQFGVTGEPLQARYRCTRGDVVLTPSIPLSGNVVQHVCTSCGRSVEQTFAEYNRLDNIVVDIRCPSVHPHPKGHMHEDPLFMEDWDFVDKSK
jgi:hypothetical protein